MLPFYDVNAKLRYIKYCLLLFTFMFVLTGVGLIAIGSTVNAIYYEFIYFLQLGYVTPATGLVLIGFVIFGVACLGLVGTVKMNPTVIGAFGGCLGAVCVLQLGAAVYCYAVTDTIIGRLRVTMNETMYAYPWDEVAAERFDAIQENFACCGMYTAMDWRDVFEKPEIPRSCCALNEALTCEYFHNTGCFGRLSVILKDSSHIISSSSAVLAFMQLIGMAFAFYKASCLQQQIRFRRGRKLLVAEQLLYSDTDATKPADNKQFA